jgi:alginate O-acetyltransferase complex protein AlgI
MLFNSWEFLYFLVFVLGLYYIFSHRAQNIFLLIASYFFYGWWDWRFVTLLFVSTITNYFSALLIYNNTNDKKRKLALYLSVIVNLGLLGTFKYFNFFVDSFVVLGSALGIKLDTPVMLLLPPVGISFYTFQSLSYTIDVYRDLQKPTSNFIDFALFVSYFPQLVAGPIERAASLLPQILNKRRVNIDMVRSGLLLILIGLFKKIAIADTAAVEVEKIFIDPSQFSSWGLWKGLYLFSIQIYCDFSGYSNIARGVSKLFGIEIMENFQTPYLSKNITEFWRRWHISLSQWLRDYVFLPLSIYFRNLRLKGIIISILLTFVLCGLWHGANWTFVAWGTLHGIYLAVHRYFTGKKIFNISFIKLPAWAVNIILIFFMFHLVTFTWIFFRAQNFGTAWEYVTGILSFRGEFDFPGKAAALILLLIPIELIQNSRFDILTIRRYPRIIKAAYYLVMILALILLSGNEIPFVYFQF